MVNIVWFRRDFRLHDNTALWHAAKASGEGAVQPVFVFDDEILRHPDTGGAVVSFMLGCLESLREAFAASGVSMRFLHGPPSEQLPLFANAMGARAVYFNKDYHPAAIARDDEVTLALSRAGVEVRSFKDQVIYEERELLAASTGEAYTVYTPYARAWRAKLAAERDAQAGPKLWDAPKLRPFNVEPTLIRGLKLVDLYTTADLGFDPPPALSVPRGEAAARAMLRRWCSGPIKDYAQSRNFPADEDGTSKVSAHLRHGTLSPRQCVRAAMYVRGKSTAFSDGADKWIGELIWREFYQQILFNFPSVVDQPFKAKLANLKWRTDAADFQRWCDGMTGFPIVDAAMRQLNATGWMHNRLRMIVAMFLTKDLRIDYKLGERYFMQRLIDGETAQNNGGWQWSSSTGTDAQPYFRIFNPTSQSRKFDENGTFIRRWLPELSDVPLEFIHEPSAMTPEQQRANQCIIGRDYPVPVVDHQQARLETLAMFKE